MKQKKGEIKRKIKGIAFDANGVLRLGAYDEKGFRGHHTLSFHHYIVKKLKLDLDTWFDAIDTPYGKAIEGTISEKKALTAIAKNLHISVADLSKVVITAYRKTFKKNKRLYGIASKLRKNGYQTGILSDQWYLSQDALLPAKDVREFNPIIVSCEVGIRKPNPKIYRLYAKKAKMKFKDILFIDNREWNLKPARKLGMKTILFENNKQCLRDLRKLGIDI